MSTTTEHLHLMASELRQLADRIEGLASDLVYPGVLLDPPAPEPHPCDSCSASIDMCDRRVLATGRGCCPSCYFRETHGDTVAAAAVRLRRLHAQTTEAM